MWGAIVVTWGYIAGELSQLIGELQGLNRDENIATELARLRREVEKAPFSELGRIAEESVALSNKMCRISLALGDSANFTHQLGICNELWCFAVSAGLLCE